MSIARRVGRSDPRRWRAGGRAVVGAALAAMFALLVTVAPAAAGAAQTPKEVSQPARVATAGVPGPFKIQNKRNPRTCLDVNTDVAGANVKYGDCDPDGNDAGQRWGWHTGGFIVNLATNQCAEIFPEINGHPVIMQTCEQGNTRQYWSHQNLNIINHATGDCVMTGVDGEAITMNSPPCPTDDFRKWYVTYW